MDNQLFDQFTYLHFAVGIVMYFWGISLPKWLIIHTAYELFESTSFGVNFINVVFGKLWPGGGDHQPAHIINSVGDTIAALIGWISAYYLDRLGSKMGWYKLHIQF